MAQALLPVRSVYPPRFPVNHSERPSPNFESRKRISAVIPGKPQLPDTARSGCATVFSAVYLRQADKLLKRLQIGTPPLSEIVGGLGSKKLVEDVVQLGNVHRTDLPNGS